MDDRSNTIAGWVLAGGIVALGLSIVSGMYFHAEAPEKEGFAVAAEAGGEAGGAAAVPIATLLATADVAKGEAAFKKCAACHTIAQGGANGIGPNLWASMGKPHGHVAGFSYSDALKSIPGNWDFEGMDKWLANPKKYAPGTKMTFAGLSNPEERANLIAYLNAQGSNLPLPPPPAADAAAPAADAATGEAAAAPAADAAAPAPAAPAAK
ncbi:c-type cytochrome [Sphingorhabdus sp.]|jgi:cytochrome c|uniref:c-type cytochrome n=1 Tax=Sphingorhabdus sp. TaxID=1902408 RepID=UPI003784CCBE